MRVRTAMMRWEEKLLAPVDISFLVVFRVALGLLLAVSMERFLAYGWVDELLLAPSFRFKYYGFSWVEPLPREAMFLLFRALVGLGCAVAAGLFFRVTAPLLALGLTYIQLIDVSTYLNHYYYAALLAWILAVSPAHRAWSVDVWLDRTFARRAKLSETLRTPHAPRAWLWLLRFQVGLVYFCAGLAKLQSDWLIHGQPLRIWLGARTDLPLLGPALTWPETPLVLSWCGFLFDTTIPFWLSFRKSRPYAYAVVLVFHAVTRLLFEIGMFPWIMSAAALVFFPPDAARRALSRLFGPHSIDDPVRAHAPASSAPNSPTSPALRRLALGAGIGYAALQVALPLRHLAYGGNVLWHEQGMRFSWRVMVRAKGGEVNFLVTEATTGKTYRVNSRAYLAPFQENEMAGQPDLILQLAHHIGRDFSARTGRQVAVRAEAKISLNGRRAAYLVDPSLDLTQVLDGLHPASWIRPHPAEAPPHTRPVL